MEIKLLGQKTKNKIIKNENSNKDNEKEEKEEKEQKEHCLYKEWNKKYKCYKYCKLPLCKIKIIYNIVETIYL
jgi:hypothetical protein